MKAHAKGNIAGALLATTCVWGASLGMAGCGTEPIGLPQEPDNSGGFTGEIAYLWQYRWDGMPHFADMVLWSGILFTVDEDAKQVRAYRSNTAEPTENDAFNIPQTVIVGDDTLRAPVQLAVGKGNTLWVAFAEGRRLQEFAIESPMRATDFWVAGDSILALGGIAVDPDSGFVYASDTERNLIKKYEPSPDGGREIAVLSNRGSGDGFVIEPGGLFVFGDSILVADTQNNRVQVIHADVPFEGREVRDESGEPIGLRSPVDVWVDRDGLFYVAESGRVTQVTALGVIKEVVTEKDAESAPAPRSVVATNTQVWVPDDQRGRLTVYQLNTVSEELP